MRTRTREIPDWFFLVPSYTLNRYKRPWGSPSDILYSSETGKLQRLAGKPIGRQTTSDENHGRVDFRNRGSSLSDVGGDFFSERFGVSIFDPKPKNIWGSFTDSSSTVWTDKYLGPYFAIPPHQRDLPPIPSFPGGSLDSMGTTAIARCKPTNNVADLSTMIGEIYRGGAPRMLGATLWKDRTLSAKSIGSEYLNTEFGWKPLVDDIREISHAVTNADRLLSQYERDAGKVVRRRYEFPVEVQTSVVDLGPSDGFIQTGWAQGMLDTTKAVPRLIQTTTHTRRVWFSGAFTYHLPVGYDSRNGMVSAVAKAGPLLGLELTPDVVWNLAPWSWAIDWFTNAGDVVSNLSDWATDGLVLRYGYVMEHVVSSQTWTLTSSRVKPYGQLASTVTSWRETKRRIKATPFGFGLTWNGLTPRQLAIAAALGITRIWK